MSLKHWYYSCLIKLLCISNWYSDSYRNLLTWANTLMQIFGSLPWSPFQSWDPHTVLYRLLVNSQGELSKTVFWLSRITENNWLSYAKGQQVLWSFGVKTILYSNQKQKLYPGAQLIGRFGSHDSCPFCGNFYMVSALLVTPFPLISQYQIDFIYFAQNDQNCPDGALILPSNLWPLKFLVVPLLYLCIFY